MFSRNVVSGGKLLLWGEKCEKRPKNKQNLLLFWGENFPPEVSENNTAPEFVAFHASSHLSFPCWPSSSAFAYYCKTGYYSRIASRCKHLILSNQLKQLTYLVLFTVYLAISFELTKLPLKDLRI